MENPKKNILIFLDWFLPGTKSGGPVRSYANMLDHLGDYCNFYIVTRNTDYCSTEVYKNVASNQWNTFSKNTSVYYFSKDQLNRKNIKKLVDETEFDIAYINGIYSWYFSILPLWLLKKHMKIIVSARGMLNPQAFSVKGFKKKTYLSIANAIGLYKNVVFHATNLQESKHIKAILGNNTKTKVAPNFPRLLVGEFTQRNKNKVTTFANVARVSIEKGTLKMINAFKKVSENVILDIYGPIYDEAYWKLCQNEIDSLPSNVTVNYKGSVESEVIPSILEQYDFFIMLSEGENFGHSILEALSAGCPVIISDKTPWQGLEEKGVGWDLNINNTEKVSQILNSASSMTDEVYKRMSKQAFEYASDFYKDPQTMKLNRELFQ
ncbi:glycosyltransferase [Aequorivita lipolytica]|uniref:Glycosyltransferase n=1 Tax=Aequorivita lipolytica TaxID=153267 RepID=A0A5C6YNZ2_9FLAO|nr:glycosyltransferase [Aequorivita lipolytica]TXD68587.1 glycosyltransferase [Aequorivita lipolytica]SRX53262.1 Glycosyltransferase Gtf1 [Aequorivita lipolytica]